MFYIYNILVIFQWLLAKILSCFCLIHQCRLLVDSMSFHFCWNPLAFLKIEEKYSQLAYVTGINQASRWRVIRAKMSPCEGWLCFVVGQKRSSSRLVILRSRPMSPPAYFLHLSFMKMSISCTCLLKSYPLSILKVTFLESNPLRFIET